MTAPTPRIPRLAPNVTARLTRPSRGPIEMVNRIRKATGCDAVWCFGPDALDEHAEMTGVAVASTELRDRCTEPSAELAEAVALLDPRTGLRRE